MADDGPLQPPGCPIRKSVDPRALAAPYRVSSLGTSFLGTPPQGIPQMPYVSLETLSLAPSAHKTLQDEQATQKLNAPKHHPPDPKSSLPSLAPKKKAQE